jgi:RNA polymerase sigma-70 factor (ECF subfamily)
MESDEQLFARVRGGDLGSFDLLYARYERSLFGFLFAMLGNRADAEDAFHETFLGTLKSPDVRFEGGAFRAWLFRIGRNVALNRLRSQARGAAVKARLPAPEPAPSAAEALSDQQRIQALDAAVSRLPPTLADVYRLRTSGLSYDEMARVLEAPVGTVKSRMHELVRVLREEMGSWTVRG